MPPDGTHTTSEKSKLHRAVTLVGAGLSAVAQIPTTSELLDSFLTADADDDLTKAVSRHLQGFWRDVFGWSTSTRTPSFEDHFTAIDLAANTGHQLGSFYTPARLRAIRRLSLHRVFETLDRSFRPSADIFKLVRSLAHGADNSIVSTNWDIVVERHCRDTALPFHYGIPTELVGGGDVGLSGLAILKLHGSSNWCYCDSCRRLFAYSDGKGVLKDWLFLEKRDFEALGDAESVRYLDNYRSLIIDERRCGYCDVRLSTRVATFSFDKALGFYQFQGVWEEALRRLREAERWIFIGYSLPEADFELRHMLKTAQLAGPRNRQLSVDLVVDGNTETVERYQRFFGSRLSGVHNTGFEVWVRSL
jgi:hypothetical protein